MRAAGLHVDGEDGEALRSQRGSSAPPSVARLPAAVEQQHGLIALLAPGIGNKHAALRTRRWSC